MTHYSIYFTNSNSKAGESQDYALFSELPTFSEVTGATPYSNIFMSAKVMRDSNWTIDITKNFYAWCGTAPQTLAPGVVVTQGMGKIATLGIAGAPGTTCQMINNGGTPAFTPDVSLTANESSYQIDTGLDFTRDMNFLIGLGGVDGNGRLKPLATMAAPNNSMVNIAPVVKYYIGAFKATVGTAINTSAVSKVCACIDFSKHPGMFAANVDQDEHGAFTVRYLTQAAFAMAMTVKRVSDLGGRTHLKQLAMQLTMLQDALSGVLLAPLAVQTQYACSLEWSEAQPAQKTRITKGLKKYLTDPANGGYVCQDAVQLTNDLRYVAYVSAGSEGPTTLPQITNVWTNAWNSLDGDLHGVTSRPIVVPRVDTFASHNEPLAISYSPDHAPAPHPTQHIEHHDRHESLEEKKKRAMDFLAAQGLGNYGLTNGVA